MTPTLLRAKPGLLKTLDEIVVLTRRNLAHIPRQPERLAEVTVNPIMFVLLFGYVFGSAIAIPGTDASGRAYREFMIGGIFVQTVAFMSITTAIGVVNDMKEGVIDRFRVLPISRISLLTARAISQMIEGFLGIAIMALAGLLVGWAPHEGLLATLAAFGLLVAFAFAMICIGVYIGQVAKQPMTAQTIGFALLFPLTFASNAFVPTDNMPTAVRVFSEWNPVSAVTAAVRDLFGNGYPTPADAPWPLHHPILATLLWTVLFTVVGLTLAVARYARGRD